MFNRSYPITTRELIEILSTGLCEVQCDSSGNRGNRQYTSAVLRGLATTAGKKNYQCYPDTTLTNQECLWDCSWWREKDRLDLILAVESEWSKWSDIRYDFDKLLVAKCPLKLLVTDSGNIGQKRSVLKSKIEARLAQHSYHIKGERYVWADVQGTKTGGAIYAYEFTVPDSSINESVTLKKLDSFADAPRDAPTAVYQFEPSAPALPNYPTSLTLNRPPSSSP